ncbi:MAG: DUF3987 domain-containing protein [Phycisphaerales bacterium]
MSERTPLDRARDLIARGLSPIPVPHKSKGPRINGWQTLRLASDDLPRYFNGAPCNLGTLLGEPAGWIVDVDLDHPRAVELADSFLPHTGMTWGRDSKPRSHRLYRLTRPADTRKWPSKTAGMIVELRSTGCQTIAPGSTHPSGEPVRWDDDGEPANIDPEELRSAISALADAVRRELGEGPDTAGAPVPRPVPTGPHGGGKYGREALRREAEMVATTPEGGRNDALNRAAFNVGTLIGGGEVDRADAESELLTAARSCGLPDEEARRTIASGIASGMKHPRSPRPSGPPRKRPASPNSPAANRDAATPVSVTVTPAPVPAFTPFPADVLPEPIRGFVTEAAKAIGCDASYVALPLLSALASAIGNTHRIALKRGWTEPAIVWTAIVGDSGTAKSPALELALRPVRERQHQSLKAHAEAVKAHAEALAIHERASAHWNKSKSEAPPPAKPEAPIADRCWTDDVTTEALAVLLQQNPRGLLLVKDELAGWFNFDRYAGGKGGGDAAKWLEMFGGRPMVVDRKTGGMLYVPRAAVSIAGGIQPETLRRALGQEHRDNGLAARLLLTCPPRRAKRWTEADVNADTEAAVAMVFDRLFGLTPETDDDGDERPRLVTLADNGKRAWVTFYNEHAGEQVNLSGDEAAAWSKLEGYAARLALVVHLTRWAAGDATLRDPARVDEASIAAGVVLARWFGDEARRVYAILSESDDDRETRRLVEWIERGGKDRQPGTATVRDLTHGLRAYRNDPDTAERELSALVESGIGRWEADAHGPKGGRPAQRFRLVSTVTVTETPANAGKDLGSGDGDTGETATDAGDGWGEL